MLTRSLLPILQGAPPETPRRPSPARSDRTATAGRALFLGVLLLGLGGLGCGRGFSLTTPAGFAELEEQEHYGYRATDAQGVVLAVRREDNTPYGDLSFWSGAVDAHLRRAGYTAVKAVDAKSAGGVAGRQIRYKINRSGREHAFWVTVFVTEKAVVTVEVGGDTEYFEALEKPITAAISSLDIN